MPSSLQQICNLSHLFKGNNMQWFGPTPFCATKEYSEASGGGRGGVEAPCKEKQRGGGVGNFAAD